MPPWTQSALFISEATIVFLSSSYGYRCACCFASIVCRHSDGCRSSRNTSYNAISIDSSDCCAAWCKTNRLVSCIRWTNCSRQCGGWSNFHARCCRCQRYPRHRYGFGVAFKTCAFTVLIAVASDPTYLATYSPFWSPSSGEPAAVNV